VFTVPIAGGIDPEAHPDLEIQNPAAGERENGPVAGAEGEAPPGRCVVLMAHSLPAGAISAANVASDGCFGDSAAPTPWTSCLLTGRHLWPTGLGFERRLVATARVSSHGCNKEGRLRPVYIQTNRLGMAARQESIGRAGLGPDSPFAMNCVRQCAMCSSARPSGAAFAASRVGPQRLA
jgi:hypothetical protein